MSEAAVTFHIFGRSCVVILPPSLDVPPANDVQQPATGPAPWAQEARPPSSVSPPRPSEIVLCAPQDPGEQHG
jgi:hypothetical protein